MSLNVHDDFRVKWRKAADGRWQDFGPGKDQ
jgi:hypothetical protein